MRGRVFTYAVLLSLFASANAAPPKDAEETLMGMAQKPYLDGEAQLSELLANFEQVRMELASIGKDARERDALSSKILKAQKGKKGNDAEVAILEVQQRKLGERVNQRARVLLRRYLFPLLAHFGKSKGENYNITRDQIVATTRAYLKKGIADLPPKECFESESIKLEKSCIGSALKVCSRALTSDGAKLSAIFLDTDLVIKTRPIESLADFVALEDESKQKSDDESGFEDYRTTLARAVFSTCSLLVKQSIAFKPEKIAFKGHSLPDWAEAVHSFYGGDITTTTKECIPAGSPPNFVSLFHQSKRSYDHSYELERLRNGIERCSNAIAERCQNSYVLNSRVILRYPTQSCEVREVTAKDLENDIVAWREASQEEALILSHTALLDAVKLCESARAAGYEWKFLEPGKSDRCKSKKK